MADFQVQCPYCWEALWMETDARDGESQDFIVDCEVCCQPIRYVVQFADEDSDAPTVQVERAQ